MHHSLFIRIDSNKSKFKHNSRWRLVSDFSSLKLKNVFPIRLSMDALCWEDCNGYGTFKTKEKDIQSRENKTFSWRWPRMDLLVFLTQVGMEPEPLEKNRGIFPLKKNRGRKNLLWKKTGIDIAYQFWFCLRLDLLGYY